MNLKNYFDVALSYDKYLDLLGGNLSLHNLHFKNFILKNEDAKKIANYSSYNILTITEPWCGDSLALLPLFKKIVECNPKWNLRVLLRDQNPDLMDKFLTNGARATPKFLFLTKNGDHVFNWGPRPVKTQEIFEQCRDSLNKGEIEKKDIILKIRKFYAKDKGKESSKELLSQIYLKLK